MLNIVIVGSSGHAKVVIDIVEKQGLFRIRGLLDAFRDTGSETLGYPVVGTDADVSSLVVRLGLQGCLIAIGDNAIRAQIAERIALACPTLPFVTAIHPAATVGRDVVLGEGSVVMAGAVVNPCSTVGRHCILNTNASLDHDSQMDDFSSLAPGVVTGGNCRIGRCSAVGIGATLRHGVTIDEHSVIGAGATVLHDVGAFCVAYGAPARRIRSRQAGESYL